MSRKMYRLIKDLPNCDNGDMFIWDEDANMYASEHQDSYGEFTYYKEKVILDRPDYFKEIKDTEQSSKPFVWTDQLVADLVGVFCGMEDEEAMKEVEEYKRTKLSDLVTKEFLKGKLNYSIPAGKGTAIDVLNTEGKDWEIVAYRNPNVITDIKNGEIVNAPNSYAVLRNYPIHSVKRLSDNQVFSVGDEVEYRGYDCVEWSGWRAEIKGFTTNNTNNKMTANMWDKDWEDGQNVSKYLENIRHKKPQPQQESKRIEVTHIERYRHFPDEDFYRFRIYTSGEVPESKYETIKSAIEKILNNE